LQSLGHLDHIVRRAVEEGIDPITAIQMVTINTAQCYQLDHEMGSIAPGRCADIVFLSDLEKCAVVKTVIDGELVAEDGQALFVAQDPGYPSWATESVRIKGEITPASFAIAAPAGAGEQVKVRAIEVIPAKVGTFETFVTLPVRDGLVDSDTSQDVLKTFVFERHHATGSFACGFTKGFGIRAGAMASTVAHDAHNLLVLGASDDDMALAANTLIASGGGSVVVRDGKVLGHVPLPIAGLMSPQPLEELAALVEQEEAAWEAIGCKMPSPFMTMALIPLACLPELRLTNRGLVDCRSFQFVDLFCE
jgi:adenine deaminase